MTYTNVTRAGSIANSFEICQIVNVKYVNYMDIFFDKTAKLLIKNVFNNLH